MCHARDGYVISPQACSWIIAMDIFIRVNIVSNTILCYSF